MKLFNLTKFKNKVSRRIFLTVLFCSFLPIAGLVSITFYSVYTRSVGETSQRLHHAGKNVGMAIMARLSSIAGELEQVAALQENPPVSKQIVRNSSGSDSILSVWLFPENNTTIPGGTEEIRERLASGQPQLSINRKEREITLLIWMPVVFIHGQSGVAVGKVNLESLWNYAQGFLPLDTRLTIVDMDYRPIFLNFENTFFSQYLLQQVFTNGHQYTEINVEGEDWLARYWDLFLLAGFNSPAWHIVVSEPKEHAFAGLIHFQKNAVLTVLMTFWIILLASSLLIRKTLTPLQKLKEATQKISKGHYTFQLDIKSHDEFETLSDSFNGMVRELDDLNIGILTALARTVDANSQWTHGHSERVTEYVLDIARELGLNEDVCENLHRAGLLHDLGKVSIPAEILNKPGKLTAEEYTLMKGHPSEGDRILEPIQAFKHIRPFIRHHHERWDGNGYPDGLRGPEIPLGARILAVADVYDALYSDRPYRKGWDHKKVLNYLKEESGGAFDPTVVKAFLRCVEKDS